MKGVIAMFSGRNDVWFIADTHFYHQAAIDFPNRSFPSVEAMHKEIIEQWNYTVKDDNDIVYILGDFSFSADPKECRKVTSALRGKKILIKGNHDAGSPKFYINIGFYKYYDVPIVFANNMILSHEPLQALGGDGFINVHGHTHGRDFTLCTDKHFCVSWEVLEGRPISYRELLRRQSIR